MTDSSHILVADDEEIVVSLVRDCLEDEGYIVETADCGSSAERLLQEKEFDLLITDIRMPDFDGIELLRRAKAIQPNISAIFMTGYANIDSAKEAIKEGALDYLMKPFEITEIRTSVRNALQKKAESDKNKSGDELDKMASLTRSLGAVDDLPSLMNMSLGFALIQCNIPRGAAIYWSPTDNTLVRVSTDCGDTVGGEVEKIELAGDPLKTLPANCPEFSHDFFVCNPTEHPLGVRENNKKIDRLLSPPWLKKHEHLVSFSLRRNDRILGFLLLPVHPDDIESYQQQYKLISMTAQHTALSIENLLLLEDARQSYNELQGLQERTIKLETLAARGEVAAEIGHELKNFLGVVYGNISLLELQLQKGATEMYPKYMAAITTNLEKMKRFTTELMREAKLSGARETIAVNSHLRELVDFMRPQKRFTGVEIELVIPAEEIAFETDPLLFQQLMYNIVNNAADACKDSTDPKISITLSQESVSSVFSVSVRDNGSGIDPELLKKAFNTRFTTKEDGHGFGLIVCRRIIDSHQGTIDVQSAPGEGATITITFPTSDKEPAEYVAGATQKITVMS
jgi:signal transduction histidine kinase/CheY-like chemotaxis protein